MKKLKKIISVGLAAAALMMTISGCGGKKDSIATIDWYLPKWNDNMTSQTMVEDKLNEIFEKEIGARVKLHLVNAADWNEKMNVVLNSGEVFDIMTIMSWYPAASYDSNAPKGVFYELNDLIDKYGADIKAKVDPRAWQYVTYNDKIQIIPSQQKLYNEIGWVFKKDLVEKYNFDYKSVKTMKDLEPYFDTLLANEPDIVPVLDIVTPNWGYSDIVAMGGGKTVVFDEEKEEFIFMLEDPRTIEDYRLRNEWYKKGYFPKDALTLNVSEAKKTGKYAVMRDSGAITEDGSKSTANYGFPCVDLRVENHEPTTATTFQSGQAISHNSPNPEKAMQMLNLVWKDPFISNTLAYGIEDVDYYYISGKGTDKPSVELKNASEQTWGIGHNFIGPLFDQWDSSWNSYEALREMEEGNKNAVISKRADVQFDSEPIKTELAALSEIWKSAESVLNYGAMTDFDSYMDELVQKCKNAGVDKVIDELNRQYKAARGK